MPTYFVRGTQTGLIKIGFVESVDAFPARLKEMQTGSSEILQGLKVGELLDEGAVHNKFIESHHHGEWFRPDEKLLHFIQGLPKSNHDGLKFTEVSLTKSGRRVKSLLPSPTFQRQRLSRREIQITNAIKEGLTNPQIARHLGIAEQTVKNHSHAIFAKIGVETRQQLMLDKGQI